MANSNNPWAANMHEMDDLPLPEISQQEHQARMQEFINSKATPPPFSNDLPGRPIKRERPWWLIALLVVICVSMSSAIITLGVLLGKQKEANTILEFDRTELAASLASPHIITTTARFTSNITFSMTATTTQHHTTTASFVSIFTTPSVSLTPTCDVTNAKVYLSSDFCTMVNHCNATRATEEDDCKNFCALNPICQQQWDDKSDDTLNMQPQLVGCCGWCACFHQHSKHDIMMWPVKPGLKKNLPPRM